MDNFPNDEKIEKYLDELADEYKILLYKALLERSSSLDNLSISELLRLDNEIKKPLLEDYRKKQRIRRILAGVGIFYVCVGIFLYIFSMAISVESYYSRERMMSLVSIVIAGIGVMFSIYSVTFSKIGLQAEAKTKGQSKNRTKLLEYEVVNKWRELEGIVNDISIKETTETPRSIIEFLLSNKFIDKNEYNLLKRFLQLRNSVVHSRSIEFNAQYMEEMIEKVNRIIEKIRKIV